MSYKTLEGDPSGKPFISSAPGHSSEAGDQVKHVFCEGDDLNPFSSSIPHLSDKNTTQAAGKINRDVKNSVIPQGKFYIGVFLITACTLMLQIIQTRILSVVAWYHLAFFAISMAMFGLTAGAVWVYLRRDRFTEKSLSYDLSYFSSAFAVTTAIGLSVQMTLAPIVSDSVTSIWGWMELSVCMSLPFFFSGVIVSLVLTRSPFPIGRVYGVDLTGAAAGCLGVLFLLDYTDAPSAILWIGVIAAAGARFFSGSAIGGPPNIRLPFDSFLQRRKLIFWVLMVGATINGFTDHGLQPLVAKGRFEGPSSHIFREWNSFSRIAVFRERNEQPHLWGPSPLLPADRRTIDQRVLNIDGDAGTVAFRMINDPEEVDFLKYDVTNLAYFLPNRKRAAVIGVGGGRDMLSAAVFGIKDITGVEINPIFVKLLTKEQGFVDFNNINKLEGTKFIVDEGRSWFARTKNSFDTIQMSLIDTWAATGAGAFTLSENGLYTVEAWKTFMSRLTPNGVFTVSRWYHPSRVNETGRMLSLAVATLMEMGVDEPRRHIFLGTQGRIATLILSAQPLSASDLSTLQKTAADYQHNILIDPTVMPPEGVLYNILTAGGRKELDQYTSNLEFDLTPPTDERPFFFNQLPFNDPLRVIKFAMNDIGRDSVLGGVRHGNLVATATLMILFIVSLALVLATIIIPIHPAILDVGRNLAIGGTLYFLLIGIGFMLVEIGLLQRMSVFLGHPIYSLSILLFTLILTMGIGSLVSDKVKLDNRNKFFLWAVGTGGFLMALPLWLPGVFLSFSEASLFVRSALCAATIAPAGMLMGFGFPTGMRLIALIDQRPTPWFWGINGAAGVLASIVAVVCSIAFGISVTITLGAICYLLLVPVTFGFIWLQEAHSSNQKNCTAT